MRVKRYIVDSMPEALDKIRVDLGQDAVILNSKPIKTGGFLGLFGRQQIEVVAAVDEKELSKQKNSSPKQPREVPARTVATSSNNAKRAYQSAAARPQFRAEEADVFPDWDGELARTSRPAPAATSGQQELSQPSIAEVPQPETVLQSKDVLQPKAELRTEAVPKPEAVRMPSSQQPSPARNSTGNAPRENNDHLAMEVRSMRQMFEKLLSNDLKQQLPPSIQAVQNRLMQQEVTGETASELIRQLIMDHDPDWDEAQTLRAAEALITKALEKAVQQQSGHPLKDVRYAFFFGPTGVGKTTTIAKLAADCMLKEKRKVGFITADTYRIAAVEQLKTYANILNVPFEVVFSPKEVPQAMERLSGCDLIFVDTAGRNYRNDEYVQGIRDLVVTGTNSLNFMVLSLTAKYSDMRTIIQNFEDIPVSRLIFTKADETEAYGAMLNVAVETNLSISYVTTGQNVPDDIVVASPRLIANMIMGE
ncbi:flagellar biosynthesis protein FlhF [Brevibacillus ruminantium]|uniref:Flagellar biosynthesis protein FlhF n=1 Tax=Brevibacillus ruminantium TaxID=2950604 RepID=A0ABY4WP74_9BACL|nr:flagellar biosynthesis protein FlhF [Brevibacillus ruminantium]USG67943.1 flagellar biosynthesis protein FlhF [Brevibacillus ruminantium]